MKTPLLVIVCIVLLMNVFAIPASALEDEALKGEVPLALPCAQNPAQPGVNERVCLDNPVTGKPTDFPLTLIFGRIVKGILTFVGAVALFFFIQGGITLMTSGGSPEKVKKGKGTLVWTVLGLAVIFASYIILDNVIKVLTR